MKTPFSAKLAVGAVALLVGGCATQAPPDANLPTIADTHKISVTPGAERLELPVANGDTSVSGDEANSLESFARLYVRQGHGSLIMSAPVGGSNTSAAALIAQDVRLRLAASGVPFAAIASSNYQAEKPDAAAPIILTFTRFSAEGPTCEPLWSQDLAHNPDNLPWNSFGCAQEANLAAMISDPADLLGPRDEDPRDAARRARVLEAYRQGQQTHAERSQDERVQVSNAVR